MARIDMFFALCISAALVFFAILLVPRPLPGHLAPTKPDRRADDAALDAKAVPYIYLAAPRVPQRKDARRRRNARRRVDDLDK